MKREYTKKTCPPTLFWPFPWLKREPALFCTPFWYIGFNRGWGEPTVPEPDDDREGLLRFLSENVIDDASEVL